MSEPISTTPAEQVSGVLASLKVRVAQEVEPDFVERTRRLGELRRMARLPARACADVKKGLERPSGWLEKKTTLTSMLGKRGTLVALCGGIGRGKTMMGVAVALEQIENGRRVLYLTMEELAEWYDAARAAVDASEKKFATELDVSDALIKPDLLIVDECGRERLSEYLHRKIYRVVNARYNDLKKDTLLVGNLDKSLFSEWLAPALAERLVQTGGFISCDWASYRMPEESK